MSKITAIVIQTREQEDEFLSALSLADKIVLDVETSGVNLGLSDICGIGAAISSTYGWYLPLRHDPLEITLFDKYENYDIDSIARLYTALRYNEKQRKIFFNARFDIKFLCKEFKRLKLDPDIWKEVRDTAVVENLITGYQMYSGNSFGKGEKVNLEDTAGRYDIVHTTKKSIKKRGAEHGYHRLAIHDLGPYCVEDCCVTFGIYEKQSEIVANLIKDPDFKLLMDRETTAADNKELVKAILIESDVVVAAAQIEGAGMDIDLKVLVDKVRIYEHNINDAVDKLGAIAPALNINSETSVVSALSTWGITLPKNTNMVVKTGVEFLKSQDTFIAKEILKMRYIKNTLEKMAQANYPLEKRLKLQSQYNGFLQFASDQMGFKVKKISKKIKSELMIKSTDHLGESTYNTDADTLQHALADVYLKKTGIKLKFKYKNPAKFQPYYEDIMKTTTGEDKDIRFLLELLRYRLYNKIKVTYFDNILADTNRATNLLFGCFNSCGTDTGRFSCLPGDTELQKLVGDDTQTVLMKDIEIGERIASKNRFVKVLKKACTGLKKQIHFYFSDGYAITSSPEHEFLTINRGWVFAKELLLTDTCISFDNSPCAIISISKSASKVMMYDIAVEDEMYYANGILVHNSSEPNLQNIANNKDLKAIFCVPPGYVYLYPDYSNMEMRGAAYYGNEKEWVIALNSGLDGHTWTAAMLFGKTMAEVTSEERGLAKTCNFLLIYGGGPKALAEELDIPVDDATALYNKYFNALPHLKKYKKELEIQVQKTGYVKLLHGRRRWLDKDKCYKAFNTLVQGSCAMFIKERLIVLKKRLKGLAEIIALIHDEVVVRSRIENYFVVKAIMKEVLEVSPFPGSLMPIDFGISITNWANKVKESEKDQKEQFHAIEAQIAKLAA